jgi:hypothetical protein
MLYGYLYANVKKNNLEMFRADERCDEEMNKGVKPLHTKKAGEF